MKASKSLTKKERLEISRFRAFLANSTMLTILNKLAQVGQSDKSNLVKIKGISAFTLNMNLKRLKKHELVNDSLATEAPYHITTGNSNPVKHF